MLGRYLPRRETQTQELNNPFAIFIINAVLNRSLRFAQLNALRFFGGLSFLGVPTPNA
jgi:hypothetical protein